MPWRAVPAEHPRFRHVRGRVVTPYDAVAATGDISGQMHPGQTLRFTVVLQSPRDLPLLPCPDYTIAFGRVDVTHQLNCTGVPYFGSTLRPDGTMGAFSALLPVNRRVGFRMRVRVPDLAGEQKVIWTLDGPETTPGISGVVRVTPR